MKNRSNIFKAAMLAALCLALAGCYSANRNLGRSGNTLNSDVEINSYSTGFGVFVCPNAARIALKNGISKIADVEYSIFAGFAFPYSNSPGVGLFCLTQVSGYSKEADAAEGVNAASREYEPSVPAQGQAAAQGSSNQCNSQLAAALAKSGDLAGFSKDLLTEVVKTKTKLKLPFGKPADSEVTSIGITVGCLKAFPEKPDQIQNMLKDIGMDAAKGAAESAQKTAVEAVNINIEPPVPSPLQSAE